MVMHWVLPISSLLAQVDAKADLPEPTKAAAIMALLAIALLGMLIVVIILLGGHWVRRVGNYRRGTAVPPDLVLRPRSDSPETPFSADNSPPTDETTITQDTKNA